MADPATDAMPTIWATCHHLLLSQSCPVYEMCGIRSLIYASVPVKEIAPPLLSLAYHFLLQNRNPDSYWRQGCLEQMCFPPLLMAKCGQLTSLWPLKHVQLPRSASNMKRQPLLYPSSFPLFGMKKRWLELMLPSWTIRKQPRDCEAARQTPAPTLVPGDYGAGAQTQLLLIK